ncbi:hypothetical protein SAC12B_0099 [Lactobacillus phage SAC12B]|uniref:Uncharacterized protein n=1 Tax=Lactobacillus phage SAC12B TaxID=2510941 RepID=A0A4Y5FH91_9CAUD|nr:hypothetical protein HWC10_gp099 [Lactobacillus phage SAC12B]QBJ03888.1 hypothetical protein SAC12B_0099 [Lactobacillus phage SAC12B]
MDIESETYLKLAVEQLNIILDDIDNEWMSRGRIKNEVREAISQLNLVNREE